MGPATLCNSYNQRSEWRSDIQSELELRQSWIIDFSFICKVEKKKKQIPCKQI